MDMTHSVDTESHPNRTARGASLRPLRGVALATFLVGGALLFVTPVRADASTIAVTNCNDVGPGSLRQAVSDAQSGDTITFASSTNCGPLTAIVLSRGPITISKTLTIQGPVFPTQTLNGNNASQALIVTAGADVTIVNMTVENGHSGNGNGGAIYNSGNLTLDSVTVNTSQAPKDGGGIYNAGGNLTLKDGSSLSGNIASRGGAVFVAGGLLTLESSSQVLSNSAVVGGGIYNAAATSLNEASLFDNSGDVSCNCAAGAGVYNAGSMAIDFTQLFQNRGAALGGAIFNSGALTITNSGVVNNHADGASPPSTAIDEGGGIYNTGTLHLARSTVGGNSTFPYGNGGGIYGSGTIDNSTIAYNMASDFGGSSAPACCGFGGGIYGPDTIRNSTVSGNAADPGKGGNLYNGGTLVATIVALAPRGSNCSGSPVVDGGFNLDDDGTCALGAQSLSNVPSGLQGQNLANNGGPGFPLSGFLGTQSLASDSAAIDFVSDPTLCPATDERGVVRRPPCDIGAFDTDTAVPPALTPEAPVVLALPVVGASTVAGVWWFRRRKGRVSGAWKPRR
jgi:hypothetical protein